MRRHSRETTKRWSLNLSKGHLYGMTRLHTHSGLPSNNQSMLVGQNQPNNQLQSLPTAWISMNCFVLYWSNPLNSFLLHVHNEVPHNFLSKTRASVVEVLPTIFILKIVHGFCVSVSSGEFISTQRVYARYITLLPFALSSLSL